MLMIFCYIFNGNLSDVLTQPQIPDFFANFTTDFAVGKHVDVFVHSLNLNY